MMENQTEKKMENLGFYRDWRSVHAGHCKPSKPSGSLP